MIIRSDDDRDHSPFRDPILPQEERFNLIERIQQAAERGKIVVLIRLSDESQARKSFATVAQQREASERILRSVGLDIKHADVVEAIGESGQYWAKRELVTGILAQAQRGEITVMVTPRHNRTGRNDRHAFDLIESIADAGGFLLAEHGVFDLSDPAQKAAAKNQATASQQDVEQRVKLNIELKLQRARMLEYRIPLPPPLLWVPWTDPEYQAALKREGLAEWLEQIQRLPRASLALSRRRDPETSDVTEWVPGPFPDADAFRSACLRMQWYLETGSMAEVLRRVHEHPQYPTGRHGLVPQFHRRRYSPLMQLEWAPVVQGTLERWLRQAANYGIYSYTSGRGKKLLTLDPKRARAMQPSVFVPDAFPSWGTPDDYLRITELGKNASRPGLKYRAERGERLPVEVRCSHPVAEGRVCGHLLTPFYSARRGTVAYRSTGCGFKSHRHAEPYGHTTGMNRRELETAVIQAVAWAFDRKATEEAIESFNLRADVVNDEYDHITEKMREVERDMEAAGRTADSHERENRPARAEAAREREREHEARFLTLERRRAALGKPEELAALSRREKLAIQRLAADVHQILDARETHRDAVLRLIGSLRLKAWLRRIGDGTFEFDVEFPTGIVLRQVVLTKRITATQQQSAWAAARLAEGIAADVVADELNAARVRAVAIPFTAARVIGTAAVYRMDSPLPGLPPGAMHRDFLKFRNAGGLTPDAPNTGSPTESPNARKRGISR